MVGHPGLGGPSRPSASLAAEPNAASRSSPSIFAVAVASVHAVPAPVRRSHAPAVCCCSLPRTPCTSCAGVGRHLRRMVGLAPPTSISRSSPRPSCFLDPDGRTRRNLADNRSLACCRACLFSIRSCACTRIDERTPAVECRPLLAFLREMQRRHWRTAVLVVHHARKQAGGVRAAGAERGSVRVPRLRRQHLYPLLQR